VEVDYLFKKNKKDSLSLVKVEGQAEDANVAKEWSEALMDVAYQGMWQEPSTVEVTEPIMISRHQTMQTVKSPH